MAREFVDTNVLLYAYDREGTKHEEALALIERLHETGSGALSIQVLQEFFVNVTSKIAVPLDVEGARERVRRLGTWPTHVPDVDDVLEAIDIHSEHRISFWDAMIVRSASRLGCDVLWTEDLANGRVYRGARVQDPFTA